MTIRARLVTLFGSLILIMILLCGGLIFLLQQNHTAFATTYHDRVIPLKQLKIVSDMFAVNVVDTIHKTNAGTLSPADGAKSIATALTAFQQQWQAYSSTFLTDQEKKLVDEANASINRALTVAESARQMMQAGSSEELKLLGAQALYPAIDPLTGKVSELIDLQLAEAEKSFQQSEENLQRSMITAGIALLLAVLLGGVIAWHSARRITSSVQQLTTTCIAIGERNDLTLRVPEGGKDELSRIGQQLNALLDGTSGLVRNVHQSSGRISQMAQDIGGASGTIHHGTQLQSAATATIASAVQQLAASITHIADNANDAQGRADRAGAVSQHSGEVIERTLQEITAIGNAIRESEQQVGVLTRQSQDIASILDVIRDVAEQTNLLALNAAIEAARAGESGRGFAVVADEVRKLAERTAHSTKQIEGIIQQIASAALAANQAMGESVSRVQNGEQLAGSVHDAVAEIADTVRDVSESTRAIASALGQQRAASNEMAQQVEQIASLSEENTAQTAQLDEYAKSLSQRAEDLDGTVRHYVI